MKKFIITNREAVIGQIADIMMDYAKHELSACDTVDILISIDEEGNGEIVKFENVGGSTMCPEDLYHVKRLKGVNIVDETDVLDCMTDEQICESLNLDYNEIKANNECSVLEYLREEHFDELHKLACDIIDDNRCEYEELSESILADFAFSQILHSR